MYVLEQWSYIIACCNKCMDWSSGAISSPVVASVSPGAVELYIHAISSPVVASVCTGAVELYHRLL